MNQTERVNNALEELHQVRRNIDSKVCALRMLRMDALAKDVMDWSVIVHLAICEIKDAQDKAIDQQLANAREGSAALLTGILGGSIVQPEAKP